MTVSLYTLLPSPFPSARQYQAAAASPGGDLSSVHVMIRSPASVAASAHALRTGPCSVPLYRSFIDGAMIRSPCAFSFAR